MKKTILMAAVALLASGAAMADNASGVWGGFKATATDGVVHLPNSGNGTTAIDGTNRFQCMLIQQGMEPLSATLTPASQATTPVAAASAVPVAKAGSTNLAGYQTANVIGYNSALDGTTTPSEQYSLYRYQRLRTGS
jgi:hypothetical protein